MIFSVTNMHWSGDDSRSGGSMDGSGGSGSGDSMDRSGGSGSMGGSDDSRNRDNSMQMLAGSLLEDRRQTVMLLLLWP